MHAVGKPVQAIHVPGHVCMAARPECNGANWLETTIRRIVFGRIGNPSYLIRRIGNPPYSTNKQGCLHVASQ